MNAALRRVARLGWIFPPGVLAFLFQLISQSDERLPHFLQSLAFAAATLLLARVIRPKRHTHSTWRWPWTAPFAAGLAGFGLSTPGWIHPDLEAWVGITCSWAVALNIQIQLTDRPARIARLGWSVGIVATVTGLAILAGQIEAGFSEEELFALVEWCALGLFYATLAFAYSRLWASQEALSRKEGLSIKAAREVLEMFIVVLGLGTVCLGYRMYQKSFSPDSAPVFTGIDEQHPFLCGEVTPDASEYDGHASYQQILDLLMKNPERGTAELGMLALGTGDADWAEQFRLNMLAEARQANFTGPSRSVKYSQFEAALRVYYYGRVREAFPHLFADGEQEAIHAWFAAINQRAWTIEWVDGLYALAFARPPVGLFHNQEIGLGLIALLEKESLSDPDLSERNREYLHRHISGWDERFRNSDDTLVYQQEWIYSSWFQSLWTGRPDREQMQRSFTWLMLQGLPDGASLRMNHPVALSQTGIAYLGATLLHDEELLWVSGRSLEHFLTSGEKMTAVPGADAPLVFQGRSPAYGSCLLYANAGTPTGKGPLAADKLVFRDGWSRDSAYILVNLRSTGWHRYKGTGTVTLMYQSGPLLVEELEGEVPFWMPQGRNQFRDKRIPRENLNGFIIRRSGVGAVLHSLTGLGSDWAQDPPQLAQVVRFENQADADVGHIRINDWHGWQHDRSIYFMHKGPVVILDTANGPDFSTAGLVWHLTTESPIENDGMLSRIKIRSGAEPAEIVLLAPDGDGSVNTVPNTNPNSPELKVQYQPTQRGRLSLFTVILTRDWINASVNLESSGGFPTLVIRTNTKQISVPLP